MKQRSLMPHFKEIFQLYGISLTNWTVYQITDSAPVNLRIASDLNIPHMACMNHELNNQVEQMVRDNSELKYIIKSIQETMVAFKTKLTHRTNAP